MVTLSRLPKEAEVWWRLFSLNTTLSLYNCIVDSHLFFFFHSFFFTSKCLLAFPLSLSLFSHQRLQTDWEIPCLFLNGKKRQHCGSGALNSIFNLLHSVSKMPSNSFLTWIQQLENCEILDSSCKHMWLCLSANVWPCLVGVYKMWEENTTWPWQFLLHY